MYHRDVLALMLTQPTRSLCQWVIHCENVMSTWAATLLAEEAERARHDGVTALAFNATDCLPAL